MTALKRIFLVSLFTFSLILFPLISQAVNVESVPNPRAEYGGWVTDMADILSAATESQLNTMIGELEAENGAEIAVVTVPDTEPYNSPKDFTTRLFNHWGIGKAEEDNGILLMISEGDRRVEIETGYGMEAILPDAKVGNILDTHILPYFKENDFDTGVLNGTKALITAVEDENFANGVNPVDEPVGLPTQELRIMSLGFALLSVLLYIFARLSPRFILLETGARCQRQTTRTKPLQLFPRNEVNVVTQENKYQLMQCLLYGSSGTAIYAVSLLILSFNFWKFFLFTALTLTIFKLVYEGIRKFQQAKIIGKVLGILFIVAIGGVVVQLIPVYSIQSIILFFESIALAFPFTASILLTFPICFTLAPTLKKMLYQTANFEIIYLDAQTGQPLNILESDAIGVYLTKAEKVAQQLGNVKYQVFQSTNGDVHIRAFIRNSIPTECPHCQELTMSRSQKTLRRPTYSHSGIRLITDTCQCCGYQTDTEKTIPRKRRHRSSSSYGSGGSSGGGGSFGGGDSGGGGAGGSF